MKFIIRNTGKTRHEFSIGDTKYQRAHAAMMKKMPGMVHADSPNVTTLEPGETKLLIWKFDQPVKGVISMLEGQTGARLAAGFTARNVTLEIELVAVVFEPRQLAVAVVGVVGAGAGW